MSRGHGPVQRALLAVLAADETGRMKTLELARRVYRIEGQPTNAQAVAIRRALGALARQGLVVRLGNLGYGHDCCGWQRCVSSDRGNSSIARLSTAMPVFSDPSRRALFDRRVHSND